MPRLRKTFSDLTLFLTFVFYNSKFLQDGQSANPEKPGVVNGPVSIADVVAVDSVLRYSFTLFIKKRVRSLYISFVFAKNRWLSDQHADQLVLLIRILVVIIEFTFFYDRGQHQVSQSLDSAISKYSSVLVETKTDTYRGICGEFVVGRLCNRATGNSFQQVGKTKAFPELSHRSPEIEIKEARVLRR